VWSKETYINKNLFFSFFHFCFLSFLSSFLRFILLINLHNFYVIVYIIICLKQILILQTRKNFILTTVFVDANKYRDYSSEASLSKHRNSNSPELHRLQTLVLRYRVTRFRVWWAAVRLPPTRRFCFLRVSLLGWLFTTGDKWYLKQVKFDKLHARALRGFLLIWK